MSLRNDSSTSLDEDLSGNTHEKKRRRVQRACDMCRLKRVRCEGGEMSYRSCNNCILNRYDCKYTQAHKKTNTDQTYILSLEARLAKMENIMKKLAPEGGISDEFAGTMDLSQLSTFRQEPQVTEQARQLHSSQAGSSSQIPVDSDDLDSSDDENSVRTSLEEGLKRLSLDPGKPYFFGQSRSSTLLKVTEGTRQGYASGAPTSNAQELISAAIPVSAPRMEFWKPHPWVQTKDKHTFSFPPDDLMASLIDSYFIDANAYSPLLHRPTFDKDVQEGLHLRDDDFGSVVLLVCAIAARSSDDPRVLLDGHDTYHSAGWKWFRQVQQTFRTITFEGPRLYRLQIFCLSSSFMLGSSSPSAAWSLIGGGLRLAQALGAQKRNTYLFGPTVETELMKRAFWSLLMMDSYISLPLGRPCAIRDHESDIDLPIECDDEYWINPDPKLAFKQPPEKPSKVAFFNCCIRLFEIHSRALRTIYSTTKSKANLDRAGPQWQERTVAELDSALNSFMDSIPDHLRWNPHQENLLFFSQSALLHAEYYSLQITVHRPFIPTPRKPVRSPFPSLPICTNAARACIHLLDVHFQRIQRTDKCNLIAAISPVFSSGMILLLNIWEGKRSGTTVDPAKDMSDVHKAMSMLKRLERRCFSAGRLWDILREMLTVGDLPAPPQEEPSSSGRPSRQEVTEASSSTTHRRGEQTSEFIGNQSNSATPTINTVKSSQSLSMDAGAFPIFPFHAPMPGEGSGRSTIQLPSLPKNALRTVLKNEYDQPSTSGFESSDSSQRLPSMHSTLEDGHSLVSIGDGPGATTHSILADDALDMWSSAPSGFEWEDWGQIFTNFGGQSDTNSFDRPF